MVPRRAEGDKVPVEVTPQTLAGMLGASASADAQVARRTGGPGVAVGLCRTAVGGGKVMGVEASRIGRLRKADPDRTPGRGHAGVGANRAVVAAGQRLRYGLAPASHRETDVHVHVQSGVVSKEGASAGGTLTSALASAFTGRMVRGDLAMTGEITLSGQVLPVGGIKEKVLAAHRCRLAGVVLPRENRKEVDEDLGDDLREAVEIYYLRDEARGLLELALRPASAADEAAEVMPTGRVSWSIGGPAEGNAAQGRTPAAGCSPSTGRGGCSPHAGRAGHRRSDTSGGIQASGTSTGSASADGSQRRRARAHLRRSRHVTAVDLSPVADVARSLDG